MNIKIFNGRMKTVVCIVIFVCMMMTMFSGCGAKTKKYELSDEIISSEKDLSFSSSTSTGGEELASSGVTGLYLDSKTFSPIVKNHDTVWRSLPQKTKPLSGEIPAVLTVELLKEGQRYVLNSQTDCVKKQAPTVEKIENGVCVKYVLSLDGDKGGLSVTVPVNYYLEDGNFCVLADCGKIEVSDKECVITGIRLMDFFGSDTGSKSGDYILVPDNSGAVIDTKKAGADFEDLSFKVYGDAESNNAMIGAFGMKKGDSAYVAVIEDGDAIASVNASVAAHSGYNRVGTYFEITQTKTETEKDKQVIYVASESYSGELRLCYRFVEGNSANYSGMAIACREHLIRTGVLSSDTVDNTGDLPFILTVVGAAGQSKDKNLVSLTSYEQLLDMLTYLKGKGFSNIYIKYKGMLTGGIDQATVSKCNILKTLGSTEDFNELRDYVSAQQLKFFLDVDIVSCSSGSTKAAELVKSLSGDVFSFKRSDLLGTSLEYGLTPYDKIDDNVISVFKLTNDNGISNICISDASAFLYSDPENQATREDVADELKSECASLLTIGDLMVEKGNFYMLNNASVISSLPLETSVSESSCYRSVPFIPLVLHATIQYASEPLNLSRDYQKAILRCVEYGALPQFEWCYEDIDDPSAPEVTEGEQSENTDNKDSGETSEPQPVMRAYSYSDWATSAYTFYEKANRALGGIKDKRMTAHYKVKNGVYCTQYGETSIYVNYTDKDVKIGGVTVPANDFMRVN